MAATATTPVGNDNLPAFGLPPLCSLLRWHYNCDCLDASLVDDAGFPLAPMTHLGAEDDQTGADVLPIVSIRKPSRLWLLSDSAGAIQSELASQRSFGIWRSACEA